MEFRILGPLYADAATGGGPQAIGQPLLQSALAVLLLRASRPCPRAWLIDALWGAEPPRSPEAALRVCISRLRHNLGDCAVRLDSVGPPGGRAPGHRQQRGYLMTVRPGELDLDEFADLAAQGQAELDMGNATAAAASLTQALALWADPPLPDLPDTPAIAAIAAGLKNQRRGASDALIDARLAAGEHELVLSQLRAAVVAEPGRERTCAQLMRAYHAMGMRKEALDVYLRARRAVREEQGAEPGAVLALLHQQILTEELTTERSTARLAIPSATAGGLPAWQVPVPPADFTGRDRETSRIAGCLSGPAGLLMVVTGGPGAGKTATAAAAAVELRDRFPDGQLYAELGGVDSPRDPQDVLADILLSLGVPARGIPPPGPARAARYRSLLAGRQVLVVADNAATASQVRPLIPAAGGAALLVTSRGPLSGLAGASILELGGLADEAALCLLGSAAGEGRIAAEPAAAAAILETCDGLPLALRLAGAALAQRPGLTVAALAAVLRAGRALDVLAADDVSVSTAICSSYRSVPAPVRLILALAGAIMPAEIPDWALADLAGGDVAVASQLTAVGLLTPARAELAGVRYRMHSLTRAYAVADLADWNPPSESAVTRLRAGWTYRAGQAAASLPALPFLPAPPLPSWPADSSGSSPASGDSPAGPGWLHCERANLLAVIAHACDDGDHRIAAKLARQLIGYQCISGSYADAIGSWRRIAAVAAADGDTLAGAHATYFLAFALAESHQLGEASRLLAACTPFVQDAGPGTAAMAHGLAGRCHSASGRHADAVRAADEAIRLAGDNKDGALVRSAAHGVLAVTLARSGLPGEAADHCQRSRQLARELGQPAYEAAALRAQAQVLLLDGGFRAAADICGEAIQLTRGYGSEITAARFMLLQARARQFGADPAGAMTLLREALAVFRLAGSVVEELTAISMLAACTQQAGYPRQAEAERQGLTRFLASQGKTSADADARAAAAQQACDTGER